MECVTHPWRVAQARHRGRQADNSALHWSQAGTATTQPDPVDVSEDSCQGCLGVDFVPVIDLLFRQIFVFFIVELESRRVVHFGVTRHPSQFWAVQQLSEATLDGQAPRFILRDNDNKYGRAFDAVAQVTGIDVLRTPIKAPRANAIVERYVGSVRRECLDHLLILSERQLYRVIKAYVDYFNRSRPHQGIG